ncbi:tRNA pseudouridine(55) synthase TruB [Alteromonas sediminis]|uniref:tRNA pseudouridine synthase B n=1 Tax=Alteromonas sediminis TaxID=2259342 RepID=A0A3N5Y5Y5_9ALTE|nr:tRNA pseudouridine(55) synthase TruB [Alteromonas sediminis]RPJ68683.1 tRNA pseudouridine(55) synthase TruB [Alteromonas sediminis]
MGRRRKGRIINGIVLLNKAVGGSSNQVLQHVRRLYNAQKAGHTGALDPLASGMLPICLGEATKFSQFLLDADKAYEVTARLGIRTTTSDADGDVVSERDVSVDEAQIRSACASFIGESMQVPSMFSALKYKGKPLYSYAREGITVPRDARKITVYNLEINAIALPDIHMTVHCSKGTYIRTIVDDLGEQLGCGAYVTKLHRTKVAEYPTDKMYAMESLEAIAQQHGETGLDAILLPMDTAVMTLPAYHVGASEKVRFQHGQAARVNDIKHKAGQLARLYCDQEAETLFLGVGEVTPAGEIQPKRVVVYE